MIPDGGSARPALQLGARLPGALDLPSLERLVRTLEDGGFSVILSTDAAEDDGGFFEPFTLLSALASLTERIGLVAAAGTAGNEPYTVARKLASLDHLSGGRAGWLVEADPEPGRAAEFVDVVEGLWDSYADDALIRDKASGIYFDRDGRQALQHVGEHFRVAGPLNIARPPQGWPVRFRSGATEADRASAARYADVVLVAPQPLEDAPAARAAFEAQVQAAGRDPADVRVWAEVDPGVKASDLAARHASGAFDGAVLPFSSPSAADRFVGEVLPALAERGVFRPAPHGTLRDQLGLPRPARAIRISAGRGASGTIVETTPSGTSI